MRDNKETVFVDRYDYKDVNDLLNEILRKTEMLNNLSGVYPKYLKLRIKSYYEIMAYNPTLIKAVEEDYETNYYILGMKIIL